MESQIMQISLIFIGKDLDPAELTRQLGIEPTQSNRRGDEWTTSAGSQVVEKHGFWKLELRPDSADLGAAILELGQNGEIVSKLNGRGLGIECSYVDIFVARNSDSDGGGTCSFEIPQPAVDALSKLALDVRITVAVVRA